MIRTFAAIPLAAEVAAQIGDLQRQLQQLLPEVRWTRPQTLHLTLRFFGDLPEESLETVGEIMLSIGRLHAPFCLDLGGVGAFPGPHRARVFWLGVRNPGPLQTLHHELERQLPLLGIPRESRPFAPPSDPRSPSRAGPVGCPGPEPVCRCDLRPAAGGPHDPVRKPPATLRGPAPAPAGDSIVRAWRGLKPAHDLHLEDSFNLEEEHNG